MMEKDGFITAAHGHRDETVRHLTHPLNTLNSNPQNEELAAKQYIEFEYGVDKVNDQSFLHNKLRYYKGILRWKKQFIRAVYIANRNSSVILNKLN